MVKLASEAGVERRRYKRLAISRPVGLKLDQEPHDARIADVSAGGAKISTELRPPCGQVVLIQNAGLGDLPAVVLRHEPDSIAVQFELYDYEKNRLIEALATLLDPSTPSAVC
jgi:hypothetical protein